MNLPVLASPQEVVAAADDPKVAIVTLMHHATLCLRQATEVEVDELLDTAAKAEAFRAYSVQKKLGKEAEQEACELRVWAERRLGKLLADRPTAGQGGDRRSTFAREVDPLEVLGVSGKESHEFQRLAQLPEDVFERKVTVLKAKGDLDRKALVTFAKRRERDEQAKAEAQEQDAWLTEAGLTPGPDYDPAPDIRNQEVRIALRTAIEGVQELVAVAEPWEVAKTLTTALPHLAKDLAEGLAYASEQLRRYEEAIYADA